MGDNPMVFDADDAIRSAKDALTVAESHMRGNIDPCGWARIGTGWATLALAIQGMPILITEVDDEETPGDMTAEVLAIKADLSEVVEVLRPIAAEYAERMNSDPGEVIRKSENPDRTWSLENMLGGPDLVTRSKVQQALDEHGFFIQDLGGVGKLETHLCQIAVGKRKGKKAHVWTCIRMFSDGHPCGKVWTIEPHPDARLMADRYLTS